MNYRFFRRANMRFTRYLKALITIYCITAVTTPSLSFSSDVKPMDDKLSALIEKLTKQVEDLKEKEMLDGVVLLTQGERVVLSEMSEEAGQYTHNNLPPQFMIGSVSKIFTAVAVLKALYETSYAHSDDEIIALVKTKLHTPLIHFLPPEKFAWGSPIPTWAHKVTLHHLLSHTSGIVQHIHILLETGGYEAFQSFVHQGHGAEYIVQQWGHVPLAFEPGSEFSYSNLGYELLAKVVSILTNMPFEDYLRTALFEPNTLNASHHPVRGTTAQLGLEPQFQGLVPEKIFLDPQQKAYLPHPNTMHDIGFAQGSGAVISTAQDLARWNTLLHDKKVLLPKALYDLLIQPYKNDHGYGIF